MQLQIDDTCQQDMALTSLDSIVDKAVYLLTELTNTKNREGFENSLKSLHIFLEDCHAKTEIPQFSGIFESLQNVMEWIYDKEKCRRKVHGGKKIFIRHLCTEEEDSSENELEDEPESISKDIEHIPTMQPISLDSTSYDKVVQASEHLSLIVPVLLGINPDEMHNYHRKMNTANFQNSLFRCLAKHKTIPSATQAAFVGPYKAAMLPSRVRTKFMEILKLCPNYSLTILGFFARVIEMDEKYPERLEALLQEIIIKETKTPGSNGCAKDLYLTLRSWKKADMMTRLNSDAGVLSRNQINANRAMVKRHKDNRKMEYRMYQNALGETLETVQHFDHCLREIGNLQDVIDAHEIILSSKDIVVFMVRLSTLVKFQSGNLVSELLEHPNFIPFIYDTSKIGDLASILATASAAEEMKAVPMHVWKKSPASETRKREKSFKIGEGSVVATLSVKACQLEDEDTKLLPYYPDRSPCASLEAAFNYIGAKSVIAKIRYIVKVIDPVI